MKPLSRFGAFGRIVHARVNDDQEHEGQSQEPQSGPGPAFQPAPHDAANEADDDGRQSQASDPERSRPSVENGERTAVPRETLFISGARLHAHVDITRSGCAVGPLHGT